VHFTFVTQAPFHTRIAPTPSGYLHLGNAFNFVLTWRLAREAGGSVRLRIDDADQEKVHAPFVEDIFRSLEWLGVDWDIGPTSPDDFAANWSQRLRYDRYHSVIDDLRTAGELFACTCTRKEIRDASPDLTYPGTCLGKGLPLDAPETAWRLRAPNAAVPFPIIKQKNAAPAYMLVSVVDDVDHGITHIVRGADLEPSTRTQRSVARLVPELVGFGRVQVHHHHLLLDDEGQKLSKSAGSTTLQSMRERGEDPQRIHDMVATYLLPGAPRFDSAGA